ncbi:hypothetical protein RYX36_008873 [Vicia faba]
MGRYHRFPSLLHKFKKKSSIIKTAEALCHKDSRRKVYDNKIVDPPVDPTDAPASSTLHGSLFVELESYLNELIQALKTIVYYFGGNNFIFHHSFVNVASNVSILVSDGTIVAPTTSSFDPSDIFPDGLP